MLKLLVCLIILAIGAYFVINQFPSLKERVIEAVNPAAKEGRLLGELKSNLDEIDNSLREASKEDSADKIQEKIKSSVNLLGESKNLLGEISKINQDTGIIGSQVGKIINAISDQTPYPADHLETPLPAPACSCP